MKKKFLLFLLFGGLLLNVSNVKAATVDENDMFLSNAQEITLTEENSSKLGLVFSETKDVVLDSGMVLEVTEELTKISHVSPEERKVVDTARCIVGTGTYEHTIKVGVPGVNWVNLVSNTTYYVSATNKSVKVKSTNTGGTWSVGYTVTTSSSFSSNYVQSDYTATSILYPGSNTYTISKDFSIQGMSGSNIVVKIVSNFY